MRDGGKFLRYEIKMVDFIKFIFIRVCFDKKYADFKTLETPMLDKYYEDDIMSRNFEEYHFII